MKQNTRILPNECAGPEVTICETQTNQTTYVLSYEAVTEMIATISAEISTLNKLMDRKDVVDCGLYLDIEEMIKSKNTSRDVLKEKLRLASHKTFPKFENASLVRVTNEKVKMDEQIEILISTITSNVISEKLRDEFRTMIGEKEDKKKELSELEVKIKNTIEIEVEITL